MIRALVWFALFALGILPLLFIGGAVLLLFFIGGAVLLLWDLPGLCFRRLYDLRLPDPCMFDWVEAWAAFCRRKGLGQ